MHEKNAQNLGVLPGDFPLLMVGMTRSSPDGGGLAQPEITTWPIREKTDRRTID